MDAVELPFPVDVVVAPKLMGPSEGFLRAGVTIKELEASKSERVSVLDGPSIEPCSSFLSDKDLEYAIKDSQLDSQDQIFDSEPCELNSQPNKGHGENLYKLLHGRGKNGVLLMPKVEDVRCEQKIGKFPINGNACSRKTHIAQSQDNIGEQGVDGVRDMSHKLDKCSPKCTSVEITQLVRQKSNLSGRRGDKRSIKGSVKTKYAPFSVKTGSSSFGSAGGANNFFGLYGLKSDNHDATKILDDPPLQELIVGNYKCPNLGKDKVRNTANSNEGLLHSVRKACSILQSRPIQTQNIAEVDSCSSKKMSTCLLTAIDTSGSNGDKGKSDMSSCNEDSYVKTEAPSNPLDLPLCQPKDVLQHLGLPTPKDLESLLLDAAKPGSSSKNATDSRSGKQITRRISLPAFPWSHTFSGHSRVNSDVVKASTSRSTCQGRWLRVGKNTLSYLNSAGNNFTDLESLAYNQSLVPVGLKVMCSDHKSSKSISSSLPGHELELLSSATCTKDSLVTLESGGKVNYSGNAEHSPRLLAAARTLYDISTSSLRHNPDGRISLAKKPSQKVTKARKLKSTERTEELHATSVSTFDSDKLARGIDQRMPSKRSKLSNIDKKGGPDKFSCVRKEPLGWSTPRSSRLSPSKTVQDSIEDTRHSTANTVRQSCIMPPPVRLRVSDRASGSGQTLRKLLPMSWNRGRD